MGSGFLKISSIEILDKTILDEKSGAYKSVDGLSKSDKMSLGNIVVLAGKNGAGKTRIIKRLEKYIKELKKNQDNEELHVWIENNGTEILLTKETVANIELVNYSHYDAQLQTAEKYTPYVISQAKDLLQEYDYGVTALNALLLLEDMSHFYSDDFNDATWTQFVEEYLTPFELILSKDPDSNNPRLFNLETNKASLSPGQQYLLRMAVACFRNKKNDKVVFVLDEPELHLHPQAQIALIEEIRSKFPNAQLWISTHSISLIAYLTGINEDTTLLYLSNGVITVPRSNMKNLLEGLVGSESNLLSIRQLLSSPEEYACTRFSVDCMKEPKVSGPLAKNPQTLLLKKAFDEGAIVLDYGAGKCRILEEMEHLVKRDGIDKIKYYAYDAYNTNRDLAIRTMKSYGFPESNYFNNKEELLMKCAGTFNYILLVNVLHEVSPFEWKDLFSTIKNLLNPENGALIIVERSELTIGESPYDEGFLMITRNGANQLFGIDNYSYDEHPDNKYIVRYLIFREYINVEEENVRECVKAIKNDAYENIAKIKGKKPDDEKLRFKRGLSLAFHLNQFANATLISDRIIENKK